ncbi:hypothetical protein [Lutibacter flavus]|uniref:NACHT domain-containing protein n=1 Tax=Lutibacter flavus TaxID=691689 RepID=A0A238VIA1_9FLAO|nr:hypothetical protein [Lutibacter flavus]SNR33966.1 hypothetical protein SAMN04488111_0531 [Lutibacter flavus]
MRNALSGYTYQKQVTLLLLSIMDVERNISKIEIEAKTTDNFDDLIITTNSDSFQFQIKDFEDVSLENLKIKNNEIFIKGNPHKLSAKHNVIFFKNITIKSNEKILEFPSYKFAENVSIVSLSRVQIDKKLNNLYKINPRRKNEMDCFLNSILDKRIWQIPRESLPQLKVFLTDLQEKSVLISHKLLEFEKLLLIEGKPGIGKSHFVNSLIKKFENNIIYRFWIGNQDRDYQERLRFENFIRDLNVKLFYDQKTRTIEELLIKLKNEDKTFIIDGLDHIENYNKPEFNSFINFINRAKEFCKIIILSRPLTKELNWNKHTLEKWNLKQTERVLKTLFHLSEHHILKEIYEISQGYPIIVKYIAEHYKINGKVPKIEQVENIDSYYQDIISNEKGKNSLSVFLCSKSYIMESEIDLFIGHEKYYVEEFIKEHPYLFDIKINRISLFHDSFNTFLRKQVDYTHKTETVNNIVSKSILNLEKRFLSRFSLFQFSKEQKKSILIKYASIKTFEKIIKNTVDFESIRTFYTQLRELLKEISPTELSINNYYDLSLIIILVTREHISTINTFYYTYVSSLIENGITDEDITSSEYLFGMYYYVKTKNAALLYNSTTDDHYDTEYFHKQLELDINEEETFIEKHSRQLDKRTIDEALKDKINFKKHLKQIIENIFIHKSKIKGYEILKSSIGEYLNGHTYQATHKLERFLIKYNVPDYYPNWILKDVYNNLLSYGYKIDSGKNEYHDLTLKELICKYRDLGSFKLRNKIHNYIRLALLEKRKIDVQSIYPYWTKYYQRKDYTLYSLPIALKTLQSENLISLKECVSLIHKIQEISEKGYRHLLADFIELYQPSKIILLLEIDFDIEELHVEWFKLQKKYINKISERTYNIQENRLLTNHQSLLIPLEEIENVLYSNKFEKLELTLDLFKAKVSFKNNQKKTALKFKQSKLRFYELTEQNDYDKYKQNSQQRFERGILTSKDINFIKREKLKPYEIAKYSDGNYTSLPEIDIFKVYEPKQIKYYFKKILYNTLINKTKSINYFYSLYYHPGNILAMIKLYRNDKEFKDATKSFERFLNLSMLSLKQDRSPK